MKLLAAGRKVRWVRRLASGGAVCALACASVAVGPMVAAHASPGTSAGTAAGTPRSASRPLPRLLNRAQALAIARKTGRSVVVSSLTMPASQTSVSPDGKFTVSESTLPVRAFRAGRWVGLNPALRLSRGRVTPEVTTDGLSLSDGGSSPFVTMSSEGRDFDLTWPTRLPAPVLSGSTATYRNVLPGVDLVVTVTSQGSFESTLVVKDAAAAADPQLRAIRLLASAPGMTLTSASGGVAVMVDNHAPGAVPAFSTSEPSAWDSAAPPAGTRLVQVGGVTVVSPSGMQAYSSVSAPGAAARVTKVPLSVSGDTMTMAVPPSALTGPGLKYPLYIDPTAEAEPTQDSSDWTEIESGYPDDDGVQDGHWNSLSALQIGYCDPSEQADCNGINVTRSMFQMPVPTNIANSANTDVESADLYLNDIWVATCTAEPMELWGTDKISSTTTWDSASFNSDLEGESFSGYGYSSSCGAYSDDVVFGTDSGTKKGVSITVGSASVLTSLIQGDIRKKQNNQTFGIRAADESTTDGTSWLQWRQFDSGGKTGVNITLVFTYYNPPNAPSPATNPGGSCSTSSSDPAQIGNDDVEFEANNVSDDYSDSGLVTTLKVYYDGGSDPLEDTVTFPGTSGDLNTTIPRATIQGWQGTGLHEFYYSESTENPFNQTTSSSTCYFDYNTAGPSEPGVTGMPAAVNPGQQVTGVAFTAPSGCGTACPTTYKYQVGTAPPVTVTATSNDWSGAIDIGSQLGPLTFSVMGISSVGNAGEAYTQTVTSTMPTGTFVPDGYFSDGSYPDLLRVGSGADASLYLSQGSSNGSLNPPLDVGSLGDGINAPSGGPADWSGATALHGNFCGNGVQDVTAYYPSGMYAGSAMILCGFGSSGTLDWGSNFWMSGSTFNIPAGTWADPSFDSSDNPVALVPAGDASQQGTGITDVIGVLGSSSIGYELNMYTASAPGGYLLDDTLESSTTAAPDGTDDWQNYTLATAQLPDSANEHGDPADTVLLALDRSTGALYESVNPSCPTDCATGPIIGTPTTWSELTVPWGATPPALVQADVNSGSDGQGSGSLEIWTVSGNTGTAYTISGTTLTKEGTGSSVADPNDDWPLNDGSPDRGGSSTTATDVVTGDAASLAGTYSWPPDTYFGNTLELGGNAYVTPPASTVSTTATTLTLSLWFKTTTAGGVIASLQGQPVADGGTVTVDYNPVLYVGTDGLLNAAWWPLTGVTITSLLPVTDGLWHHAVLTASGGTEYLYLDGTLQHSASGTPDPGFSNPNNLTFGSGYIGGNWPDEPHYKDTDNTAYLEYFTGQLADITLTQ
jgi:hypothetical protein